MPLVKVVGNSLGRSEHECEVGTPVAVERRRYADERCIGCSQDPGIRREDHAGVDQFGNVAIGHVVDVRATDGQVGDHLSARVESCADQARSSGLDDQRKTDVSASDHDELEAAFAILVGLGRVGFHGVAS
jgi:hypothetical protein